MYSWASVLFLFSLMRRCSLYRQIRPLNINPVFAYLTLLELFNSFQPGRGGPVCGTVGGSSVGLQPETCVARTMARSLLSGGPNEALGGLWVCLGNRRAARHNSILGKVRWAELLGSSPPPSQFAVLFMHPPSCGETKKKCSFRQPSWAASLQKTKWIFFTSSRLPLLN